MASAATRAATSVPPHSTACASSAFPGSAPGAAARSSLALAVSPACSDESTTAADPALHSTVPRCAESVLPPAAPASGLHLCGPSSAAAPSWPGSAPRLRSTLRGLTHSADRSAIGSCRSTTCRSAPAHARADRLARLLQQHVPACVRRFLRSLCPARQLVPSWDGNHIL